MERNRGSHPGRDPRINFQPNHGADFIMPKKNNQSKQKGGKMKKKPNTATAKGSGAYSIKDMANIAKGAVKQALSNKETRSMLINGAGSVSDRFVPGSRNTAQGLAKFLLNKVSGTGDYALGGSPVTNSLFKQKRDGSGLVDGNALSIPKMHNSGNSIRVSHREYVMDIVAPSNGALFNPMVFTVNPGDASIFPWLSSLAVLFEQYKFHGLVFEFVSTTSPYNQTPAMGYVMFAATYNVLQAPFQNAIELENSTDSIMARPDHCIMYGLECQTQSFNYYFVKNSRNVIIDPATYNFVDVTLATQGLPTSYTPGSVLGQLWISFDVELVQPIYQLPKLGTVLLAGNPANNQVGNFLAPFESTIAGGSAQLNFNGRFTPLALNGNSKPLFSTLSQNDSGGTRQTRLVVNMANLETGNGVLVQLTLNGIIAGNSSTTLVSGTPTGSQGVVLPLRTNPSIAITGLVNCVASNYDPYSAVAPVNLNQQTHQSSCSTVLSPNISVVVQSSTFASNGRLSYTYTFYVTATGPSPAFIIDAGSNYVANNVMTIGGVSYTAQLNMTLIRDTTVSGTPIFVPISVPTGVVPVATTVSQLPSMSMNRPFATERFEEDVERHNEKELLIALALKHGLTIGKSGLVDDHYVTTEAPIIMESSEDDFEDLSPSYIPRLSRSLSFAGSTGRH